MFVGWNGGAKGSVAQMLERIGQRVVCRIPRVPEAVAFRELLRGECSETQQIVRAILNHVDAQIISRVNSEIRPMSIAERKAPELNPPVKRRMFQAFDFGDVHQPDESLLVENLSVRSEHAAQFKSQNVRVSARRGLIDSNFFRSGFSMQAAGLKQNRNRAARNNRIHLTPIERRQVPGLPFDVSSRDERNIFAQRIAGPSQY